MWQYLKILVIFIVVFVKLVEVLGQLFGTLELVHVEERFVRGTALIVFQARTHGNGQNVMSKKREKKTAY
jgi:hypothetical protein